MRQEKVTFNDIYSDFKARLPNLSRDAAYWKPSGYLSIQIFFKDGSQMIYDYLYRRGVFTVLPQTMVQAK